MGKRAKKTRKGTTGRVEPEIQRASDISGDMKAGNGVKSRESVAKKGEPKVGEEKFSLKGSCKYIASQGLFGFVVGVGIFGIILAIAGFLSYIAISSYGLYFNAEYKYKVQATLIEKTKKINEREVFDYKRWKRDGKKYYRKDDPMYRETKRERVYILDWEYYIDGERHTLTTADRGLCFRRVGSKKSFRVYSNDGKEYKIAENSILMILFLILTSAVTLLMAYCIILLIIEEIIYLIKKAISHAAKKKEEPKKLVSGDGNQN